ncbi:MAG: nickel-dependent lactate racemase [Candidatus Thorarchaeota archaeon]
MKFDYGKTGIEIKLDPSWNITILKPIKQLPIENPITEIKKLINHPIGCLPLKDIINKKSNLKTVCIVSSDITRPVPSNLILEALIEELITYGIEDHQITILIATGLHRPSNEEDLQRILGKKLQGRIRVISHRANDKDSLIQVGIFNDGIPILINKNYYNADLKILTGYVEPHFFFGFSGGRKSIVPGIAGAGTIQINHSAKNISSKFARFGIYNNNPLHQHSIEISNLVGSDFIINVCINEQHKIVQIAAGDLVKAHEKLVEYQLTHIFREIQERYDIVICGNGGYPLDLNLYQAIKSMAIGEMAVKNGGTVIAVNECIEGIGVGQEKFKDLIFSAMKPSEIYQKILNKEIVVADQWEIQILARILIKADIFIISALNSDHIGNIGLKYAKTVEEAVESCLKKYGTKSSILILPNGPLVLPFLKRSNINS